MNQTKIQRGIVSVRADAGENNESVAKTISELGAAFDSFKARYNEKIDQLQNEVEDAHVKLAAGDMTRSTKAEQAEEPATFAAAGLTPSQVKSFYIGRARASGGDKTNLGDFLRGVAGMPTTEAVKASLAVGTDNTGGYAVPHQVMPTILDALTENSAVLRAGARILPLEGAKSVTIAAVDTLPTPGWRDELGLIDEDEPTFRGVTMTPRSLAVICRVSRELLADAPDMDRAIRTAVTSAIAAEIDRVCLVGSGIAPEPKGIFGTVGVNASNQSGANFAWDDVVSAWTSIAQAKGPQPTHIIVSPAVAAKMGTWLNGTGDWLLPPPLLQNLNIIHTTGVPDNLGTGSNESVAFLGDFGSVILGMRENMSIVRLSEAYAKTGEIAFLVHSRMDVACQYPQALATIAKVK